MLVDGNDLIEAGEDQPDKIKPIQVKHEQAEDWSNPNWDPEPIDAAPGAGKLPLRLPRDPLMFSFTQSSRVRKPAISSVLWSACTILVKRSSSSCSSGLPSVS
jgi:hypothetical protein